MRAFADSRVLVLGLGITGRSAANFCAPRCAAVVAADERAAGEISGLEELDRAVTLALGGPFPDPADFDLVVPSPGVPRERYVAGARRVWGDIELAWRHLKVPIVAITGTNGKSTTALLTLAMLRSAGLRAAAAGNLGRPALDLVGKALDVAVLEVSSFQLETTEEFRPAVAVVLNITPDHLDRHGTIESYTEAKARILANQRDGDVAVLNFDDPRVRGLADRARGRVVAFRTAGAAPGEGAWIDAGAVVLRDGDGAIERVSLDGMRLTGAHNRENAVAALAAAVAAGADPGRAARALASFSGLPHRGEIAAVRRGVRFVDDSKATNPGAAMRSLCSADDGIVWIAGGLDKGLDYGELADAAIPRVRAAVLIGQAAEKLAQALAGRCDVHMAGTIEEAVATAARLAAGRGTVLLAPACASQDQFRDYAERGERFCAAVRALPDEGGAP